jgi:large subunit ribosomal protein L35
MPKMKTKRAAAKRYKVSATGKIIVASTSKRHLLSRKTRKRKRQLKGTKVANVTKQKMSKLLLPYA